MNNRRTLSQYCLSLPVLIRLKSSQEFMWSEWQTRDISARSVYPQGRESIAGGSHVEMYFTASDKFTRGAKALYPGSWASFVV
jgi:hypothetical protein